MEEKKYESDKVIGTPYREAVKWIDAMDLWDEVIDIQTDGVGTVTAIIH